MLTLDHMLPFNNSSDHISSFLKLSVRFLVRQVEKIIFYGYHY